MNTEIDIHDHQLTLAALRAAFLNAAERAKQTNTYLVVMENDQIRKIPANEIDAYIARES